MESSCYSYNSKGQALEPMVTPEASEVEALGALAGACGGEATDLTS